MIPQLYKIKQVQYERDLSDMSELFGFVSRKFDNYEKKRIQKENII